MSIIKNQVERETTFHFINNLVFLGKIQHKKVSVARDAQVGEIITQLEQDYPESFFTLNSQLSHLQEDDTVEDVFEEGDVLTAVRRRHNIVRNVSGQGGDLVCLVTKDKQPILLQHEIHQCLEIRTEDFMSTVAVFR